jgi:hypothetical protein
LLPDSPQPPQRKKLDPSGVHTEPSHWLHETFIFTHSKKKEVGEGKLFYKKIHPLERKVGRGKIREHEHPFQLRERESLRRKYK